MLQVSTIDKAGKYMSFKIPEHLNKIIFGNTLGNKNLSKVQNKKDNKTVSVNAVHVPIN